LREIKISSFAICLKLDLVKNGDAAKRQQGFTLIEILVVMSIIAVMASLFTLSVQGRDDDDVVDDIVTTFIREANYAREEIMFRRFPIGIYLYNGGYAFYTVAEVQRKDETQEQQREVLWKPLKSRLLKQHHFPDGLSLTFYQETAQTPVVLENEIPDEVKPQIVFVTDTDAIPFELLFSYGESDKLSVIRYPSGKVRRRDET
jgi:type II secretion system protein H